MNHSVTPKHIAAPWWWLGLANRPGSRRLRRRLVIGTWAVWLALALIVVFELNPGGWLLMWAPTGIAMLLWLGGRRYVDTPSLAEGELDERLKQVGTSALATAYRIFTPFILIALPLAIGAANWLPRDRAQTITGMAWLAAFMLGTTLPTMIVAWSEPEPADAERLPA